MTLQRCWTSKLGSQDCEMYLGLKRMALFVAKLLKYLIILCTLIEQYRSSNLAPSTTEARPKYTHVKPYAFFLWA